MEERISSLKSKMDAIADLKGMIGDLRADMERHFMWMVGIQFSVLVAVIVALIRLSPR